MLWTSSRPVPKDHCLFTVAWLHKERSLELQPTAVLPTCQAVCPIGTAFAALFTPDSTLFSQW
jgi:hypothetical protein